MAKKKNKNVGELLIDKCILTYLFRSFVHGVGIANENLKMRRVRLHGVPQHFYNLRLAFSSAHATSEGEAFQMQHVSTASEHCGWTGGTHPAGTQTRTRKVCFRLSRGVNSAHSFYFSLPRIENALPMRDGYEIEIFGMEGIPAPDVADYKRRKEIELGLSAGSISAPQAKRPKVRHSPRRFFFCR
jgi:hypothetical protein